MTTTQLAPVQRPGDTHDNLDRGTTLPADQRSRDAHGSCVGGNPTSGSSQDHIDAHRRVAAAGSNSPTDQCPVDAQVRPVLGGSTSEQANFEAIPSVRAPVRNQRAESNVPTNTQLDVDSAPFSGSSQRHRDAQDCTAAAGSHSPTGHIARDTQADSACGGSTSTGTETIESATPMAVPSRPGGWLRDPLLGTLADVLNDLESIRIANTNRVRILTRNEADSDGEERGHGLTEDNPEVAKLILTVKAMEQLEHDATLNLQRAMRKHPLGPFVKRTVGLGEKQTARLLATIGDPYWNDLHDKPRRVSDLWAYCGFHVVPTAGSLALHPDFLALHPGGQSRRDTQRTSAAGVAPKRTRGQKSNWSEDARKRTWLIASAIPKFKDSPYEPVYRAARVKYADTVHPAECVRCGPKGKPAQAGSPLSLGHQNARAHRIVAKEILKDLWLEARSLYGEIA